MSWPQDEYVDYLWDTPIVVVSKSTIAPKILRGMPPVLSVTYEKAQATGVDSMGFSQPLLYTKAFSPAFNPHSSDNPLNEFEYENQKYAGEDSTNGGASQFRDHES